MYTEPIHLTFSLEDLGHAYGLIETRLLSTVLCSYLTERWDDQIVIQEGALEGLRCIPTFSLEVWHAIFSLRLRTKNEGLRSCIDELIEDMFK